jgi:hypothetical protein
MQPQYIIQVLMDFDGPLDCIEQRTADSEWRDIGEGPFESFDAADAFATAEVGVPYRICAVVPIVERLNP